MHSKQTKMPSVATSEYIEGQGEVPFAKIENVSIPSMAKKGFTSTGQRSGEQTARGFGLQLRATKFVVR